MRARGDGLFFFNVGRTDIFAASRFAHFLFVKRDIVFQPVDVILRGISITGVFGLADCEQGDVHVLWYAGLMRFIMLKKYKTRAKAKKELD